MSTKPQTEFFARFNTADLPEKNRVSAVRDILLKKPVPFDVKALPDGAFFADMQVRSLPGLELTAGHLRSYTTRTAPIMQDGKDDLLLAICIEGRIETSHRGSTDLLMPGMAQLGSCADPIIYHTDVQRGLALRIPKSAIVPFVPNVEDLLGKRIPDAAGLLRLIDLYVRSLERDEFHLTGSLSQTAVTHVHDLAALLIGATRDAAAMTASRGLAAARLIAIKKDVRASLANRDISADTLAARHAVTPRYIRRLFEQEGTTLSAFVLEERLRTAERMLVSPAHLQRPVSLIAYDVGFNDISYFNRTFRRRFKLSPSEARACRKNLIDGA